MSSNFLDLEPTEEPTLPVSNKLKEMLSRVPMAQAPPRLHQEITDELASRHGFASREPSLPAKVMGGRRHARGVPAENTRQLSIRMPLSLYNEFIAFADSQQMSYNEAIKALLNLR